MEATFNNRSNAKTCLKGEQGFTLLEVLIASIILAIGLMTFATAESISVVNARRGQTDAWATATSDEILERIRRNRINMAAYNGFDTANAGTRPGTVGILQNDYDEWKVNVEKETQGCGTVQVVQNTPVTAISTVTVTVWQPPCAAAARNVVVQTLFE